MNVAKLMDWLDTMLPQNIELKEERSEFDHSLETDDSYEAKLFDQVGGKAVRWWCEKSLKD